jgi:hypothetical protein
MGSSEALDRRHSLINSALPSSKALCDLRRKKYLNQKLFKPLGS